MIDAWTERVLVFAPRGRDAELMSLLLAREGLEAVTCASANALVEQLREGAGCAIVTNEALSRGLLDDLDTLLAAQPPWSDYPFVVLTSGDAAARDKAFDFGNMTILERPVSPQTLLAAVRAALRGRRRQYDARAAIQQRDQFLAMLGHELRNPLAAIVLAADPLSADAASAAMAKRLAIVARQAAHLTRLVNDLLDVARVSTGKVQLRHEAVDVDTTVRACLEALEARAHEREIGFVFAPTCGAVIAGDGGRIEQIVGNLVTNAIKYSPQGRTITISTAIVEGCCEIRVRDQGIGIAPDMLPRVFDLFAQADGSLDRSEGGLGIGLALVERLVGLHGGSVSVSSAGIGCGSEFLVRLPVGAPPEQLEDLAIDARSLERPLRVVVVDDNPDLLDLTALMLRDLDCEVATAADGEEGLDRILEMQPDLAIVDIGLPKLDGFGLAKVVHDRLPDTLLVAITGYGQRQDRERALDSGFHEHLTKPVTAQQVKQLIDDIRGQTDRSAARESM